MCGQWMSLIGYDRQRDTVLQRAHEIAKISRAPLFKENAQNERNLKKFEIKKPKAKLKTPKFKAQKFKGGSVEERMKHILYCFQKMEEEALINEQLHQRKLEREIKLEIREKVGYTVKPMQKQDDLLRTNFV